MVDLKNLVIDFAVIEPKLYFIVDEIKTDEN
jgi:hypothetical protein